MKIYMAFLSLFTMQLRLEAQSGLKAGLQNIEDTVTTICRNSLKSEKQVQFFEKSKKMGHYIFVPYCVFKGNEILNDSNIFKMIAVIKDPRMVCYLMTTYKDSFFVMPNHPDRAHLVYGSVSDGYYVPKHPLFQMYLKAKACSKYAFILRVANGFSLYKCQVVAYLDKNSLKIFGFNGYDNKGDTIAENYETLTDFIIKQFGSLESYYNYVKQDESNDLQ